jgi:isopropylmalate/homocitrate/citramalate synthase
MLNISISGVNSCPEVKAQVRSKHVIICDATLRDGELAIPQGYTLQDYVRIAHLLDEIGVPLLQVCYPGLYEEHKEAAIALKRERLKARIEVKAQGTAPNWRQQIDDCLEVQADQISLQFSGSAPRYQKARNSHWTEDSHIDAMQRAVQYGKNRGGNMDVTATDGSRGELPFLLKFFGAAVEAGAVQVRLNESVPNMSPVAFKYLVGEVKDVVPVTLGVHCHNHWGLGLANACAAVEAGAELVDVTVNGIGGHSGMPALDEAVMVFKYLYGLDLPIETSRFVEISRVVEEISGLVVPPTKPLVGRNVYAHSGQHGLQEIAKDATVLEPFPPELVGNRRRFPLQWDVTDPVIRYNLALLGIDVEGLNVPRLIEEVRCQARDKRRELEPVELQLLVEKEQRKQA